MRGRPTALQKSYRQNLWKFRLYDIRGINIADRIKVASQLTSWGKSPFRQTQYNYSDISKWKGEEEGQKLEVQIFCKQDWRDEMWGFNHPLEALNMEGLQYDMKYK